jgi:hypothetical protein
MAPKASRGAPLPYAGMQTPAASWLMRTPKQRRLALMGELVGGEIWPPPSDQRRFRLLFLPPFLRFASRFVEFFFKFGVGRM